MIFIAWGTKSKSIRKHDIRLGFPHQCIYDHSINRILHDKIPISGILEYPCTFLMSVIKSFSNVEIRVAMDASALYLSGLTSTSSYCSSNIFPFCTVSSNLPIKLKLHTQFWHIYIVWAYTRSCVSPPKIVHAFAKLVDWPRLLLRRPCELGSSKSHALVF